MHVNSDRFVSNLLGVPQTRPPPTKKPSSVNIQYIDMIQIFFLSSLSLRKHNSKIKAFLVMISELCVLNNHYGQNNNISSLGVCDID